MVGNKEHGGEGEKEGKKQGTEGREEDMQEKRKNVKSKSALAGGEKNMLYPQAQILYLSY